MMCLCFVMVLFWQPGDHSQATKYQAIFEVRPSHLPNPPRSRRRSKCNLCNISFKATYRNRSWSQRLRRREAESILRDRGVHKKARAPTTLSKVFVGVLVSCAPRVDLRGHSRDSNDCQEPLDEDYDDGESVSDLHAKAPPNSAELLAANLVDLRSYKPPPVPPSQACSLPDTGLPLKLTLCSDKDLLLPPKESLAQFHSLLTTYPQAGLSHRAFTEWGKREQAGNGSRCLHVATEDAVSSVLEGPRAAFEAKGSSLVLNSKEVIYPP